MAKRIRSCFRAVRDEETARLVQSLSSFGVKIEDICTEVGINHTTLYKLYSKEIAKGQLRTHVNLARRIYKKAMDGDTACLIFLSKVRLGWKEKAEVVRIDHTSSDGTMSPQKAAPLFDISLLSPEQIAALRGNLPSDEADKK